MTRALMIDLETLSLSANAHVLQVGLVTADLDSGEILLPPTTLFIDSEGQEGRHIDPGTVTWWMHQDRAVAASVFPDAQAEAHITRVTPDQLRNILAGFITEGTTVWAKPSTFDIPVLTSLFKGRCPWPHWAVRDLYTLIDAIDPTGALKPPPNQAAHNAAADAEWQMQWLLALWKRRNELLAAAEPAAA